MRIGRGVGLSFTGARGAGGITLPIAIADDASGALGTFTLPDGKALEAGAVTVSVTGTSGTVSFAATVTAAGVLTEDVAGSWLLARQSAGLIGETLTVRVTGLVLVDWVPPPAPSYDGSLTNQTFTEGGVVTFAAGAGFSGADIVFTASTLPAGLTINAATGQITGTPTLAATALSVTITATNTGGTATGTFSITIEAAVTNMLVGAPTAGPLSTIISPEFGGDVRVASVSGARTSFYWIVSVESGGTYRLTGDYIRRSETGNAQLMRMNADADLVGATYGATFNLQTTAGGFTTPPANTTVDPNPFTLDIAVGTTDAAASVGFVSTVPHPFTAEFSNLSLVRIV